jgi:2-dehydro-3-deoxyphosphogalactonate aldolase
MDLTRALAACPLVAILRGLTPEEADGIGDALLEAGFTILEVPLNSPRPFESIRRLARRFAGRAIVGAGTVLDPADCARLAEARGQLVVTPHADPRVVAAAKEAGLLAIPGFFTPAEAFSLIAAGADALKLFPAEGASPAMLKAMLAVLPKGTRILPVGGVDVANLPAWRAAGAAGAGIGGALYRPGDTPAMVLARARALLAA